MEHFDSQFSPDFKIDGPINKDDIKKDRSHLNIPFNQEPDYKSDDEARDKLKETEPGIDEK